MSNVIIKNKAAFPVNFHVKDGPRDLHISLNPGEFIFSNNSEDTRSIIIHKRKRILEVQPQEKPEHLDYFNTYNEEHLAVETPKEMDDIINVAETETVLVENYEEKKQQFIDWQVEKIAHDLYDKIIKESFENGVCDDSTDIINETQKSSCDIINESEEKTPESEVEKAKREVEKYVESGEEIKKKRKRRTRNKLGRPKKRGRKKKKNPVGRPRKH